MRKSALLANVLVTLVPAVMAACSGPVEDAADESASSLAPCSSSSPRKSKSCDAGTATDSGTTTSDAGTTTTDSGTTSTSSDGGLSPAPAPTPSAYASQALKMADFLLSKQTVDGAIPDEPGGSKVNEDSNMEYALIGLAAAYWYSHDSRYLSGLEKGIAWLAAREEMSDPAWAGSWYYTYASTSPYAHVATSPGGSATDVRGVDATSALFAYLVYLDAKLTGSMALATKYEANAKAALNFVLTKNISKTDGFSLSSYQLIGSTWTLWPYEYAADQGDVYLGLEGGALLYDTATSPTFGQKAAFLRANVPATFFLKTANRYAIGRDEGAALDTDFDYFDGVFPNAYLPWMFGTNTQDTAGFQWLQAGQQADGSIVPYAGCAKYSITVATFAAAATGLGQPVPTAAIDWLVSTTYNPNTGAVRDTADVGSDIISNVIGFSIVGLLGFPTLL